MSDTVPGKKRSANGRKNTRFVPDPLDVAYIDYDVKGSFAPDMAALIVDEASTAGVGLVHLNNDLALPGLQVRVKVGRIDPLLAVIRWSEELGDDLVRVGLEFAK